MVVKGKQETFAPVTRRHIRSHGCRDLMRRGRDSRPIHTLNAEDGSAHRTCRPRPFRIANQCGLEIEATPGLVPLHRGFDWLIFSHFKMGRFSGATSSSMLLATPGWRRIKPARSMVRTI